MTAQELRALPFGSVFKMLGEMLGVSRAYPEVNIKTLHSMDYHGPRCMVVLSWWTGTECQEEIWSDGDMFDVLASYITEKYPQWVLSR